MASFKSDEVTCVFSECSSNARAIGAADANNLAMPKRGRKGDV